MSEVRLIEPASEEERERTGTLATTFAHVVTAIIGSGVLSIPWSMSKLGWSVGPVVIVLFSGITYISSLLQVECYKTRDPWFGKRNKTYMEAVVNILERGTGARPCAGKIALVAQGMNLVGSTIGYTITSSMGMVAIQQLHCRMLASCSISVQGGWYTVMFGALQLLLSQVPDISNLWWISVVAAITSFGYSLLGLGLSIEKFIQGGCVFHGSTFGQPGTVWEVLQALGNIAFAYSFSSVLLEIQDTIRPPTENQTMKKAATFAMTVSTVFYLALGCFGYAAFGDAKVPGNVLTGFEDTKMYHLVDAANLFLVVHLLCGYQVFAQPVYASMEATVTKRFPTIAATSLGRRSTKMTLRVLYVLLITAASLVFPFFNAVLGLVGAVTFWPLTVYLPVKMYLKQSGLGRKACWTRFFLQIMSIFALVISIVAAVGSFHGLFVSSQNN